MATRLPPLPPQPPQPPPSPPQQIIISPPRTCTNGVASCSPLCPNLCSPPSPAAYNYYPDDPSAMPGGSSSPALSPLLIALISILAAAFLLVSYYVLSTSSFFRRSRGTGSSDPTVEESQSQAQPLDPNTGLGESLISRIALLKYRKNDGLVVSTDCTVCLEKFNEGESLRLLPECTHAFHVDCIDKWLEAHSNCPICRTGVISVPQPVQARVVPRVQPQERENRGSNNGNGNNNSNNTNTNVQNGDGNREISNSNPSLIREERRGGGLVVIVDPGTVGRVQEIIEVGNDSIRPVSRQPMLYGRELKPVKSNLMR
ncbi:RING/U-box superfamily protein [Rhynchospora pubera]|uniref:RING-type E3 ubiquitin transferase n=1 Tax=Rhynchospora pubera TaxID=906938 RepID=A0AAV8F904_9POAL|nr:RING/U-box superfamily protein [Rhynchospora pubera]KAJ4787283.1 RING/U-box superfamily protein [Rhynchospora pubera]